MSVDDIRDMSPRDRDLLKQVELGIAGERFLESQLGAELIRRMEIDHDDAMSELLEADPFDNKKIREIQNRAKLPIMFLQYLNDIISEGQQAEKTANGEE